MNKEEILQADEDGMFTITLSVNGELGQMIVSRNESLVEALRHYGWKGTKKGCDTGDCGSCTVLLNDKPVLGCMMPAVAANGGNITTIEGLGTVRNPHPIQEAFVEAGAVQCGYCIPGMILSTKALLDRNPEPTEAEIRKALDGNLCRCTGYVTQVQAVNIAARKMKALKKKQEKTAAKEAEKAARRVSRKAAKKNK
ncbi:MAG: (2Fe-2S)-binding protein [Elusimicrobiales bacterium]|nr:(2Fe-2S)-binding protein [Elusimicrobiales bacterium]